MDDDVAIVHQHPAAFARALDGEGQFVVALFHTFTDVIRQRFQLAIAGAGADDEEVSDDGVGAQIQQDDVLCLLVLYQVYNVACKFQGIQKQASSAQVRTSPQR